jgi:hypothetical protein
MNLIPIEPDQHPDEEQIERYAMGALQEQEADRLEEHLLLCQDCRRRLAEADEYIPAMKGAAWEITREEYAGESRPRRWVFRLIPAVAALFVVVAAVSFLRTRQSRLDPALVPLQAMRGVEAPAAAPSGKPLRLQLDLTGLPASESYTVEMVDRRGNPVWRGPVTRPREGLEAAASVPAKPAGIYFVRVYLPSGELLREYAMEIRGTA